jgi:hypothetical protein
VVREFFVFLSSCCPYFKGLNPMLYAFYLVFTML